MNPSFFFPSVWELNGSVDSNLQLCIAASRREGHSKFETVDKARRNDTTIIPKRPMQLSYNKEKDFMESHDYLCPFTTKIMVMRESRNQVQKQSEVTLFIYHQCRQKILTPYIPESGIFIKCRGKEASLRGLQALFCPMHGSPL